jgi:hypothetical protein
MDLAPHNSAFHICRPVTKMQMKAGISTALVGYYMKCFLKTSLLSKVCYKFRKWVIRVAAQDITKVKNLSYPFLTFHAILE